jgi:hypothetical protein
MWSRSRKAIAGALPERKLRHDLHPGNNPVRESQIGKISLSRVTAALRTKNVSYKTRAVKEANWFKQSGLIKADTSKGTNPGDPGSSCSM